MSAVKWALEIVGVLLLLMGIVFALQGAYGVGGGSSMDNNPIWIYIGAVIALIGLLITLAGSRRRS